MEIPDNWTIWWKRESYFIQSHDPVQHNGYQITDIIYSKLPKFPYKVYDGSAINYEVKYIILGNGYNDKRGLIYKSDNGECHSLPSLDIGRNRYF